MREAERYPVAKLVERVEYQLPPSTLLHALQKPFGSPHTQAPIQIFLRGGSKKVRRIFLAGHWLGANWAPPGDNYTALPDKGLARPASPWDTRGSNAQGRESRIRATQFDLEEIEAEQGRIFRKGSAPSPPSCPYGNLTKLMGSPSCRGICPQAVYRRDWQTCM